MSHLDDIEYRAELRKERAVNRDELHLGRPLNVRRIHYPKGSGPRERAFVKTWFGGTRTSKWRGILPMLLSEKYFPSPHSPTLSPEPAFVTKREAQVVATFVRWLGTNVGFCFLEEALREAGYRIEPLPRQALSRRAPP